MLYCNSTGVNIKDTDFGYTLSLINGKYKMSFSYLLAEVHCNNKKEGVSQN